jgi:hypothetical protein
MGLEDKYLDVLQNMEAAITGLFRETGDLNDHDVMTALDALIQHYRDVARNYTPKEISLGQREALVFDRVQEVCEIRLGKTELSKKVKIDVIKPDVVVACLRKIRKSVERWNDREGRQGYLQFISNFV